MRPTTSPNFSWLDLAGILHGVEHRHRGRQREGQLLHRRRPRLLQMVGADVHRVPLRQFARGEDRDVLDQPHRGRRRKHVSAARQIFLDDVVLDGAGEGGARRTLLVGHRDVERHQPRCGGVDGHRGVHGVERDAGKQCAHVAEMADRHADLADLAVREHVVAVVAGLGRQIEGDREAGLPLRQVLAIERVGIRGRGMAGIGPEYPGLIALGFVAHRLACRRQCGPSFAALQHEFKWRAPVSKAPNLAMKSASQRLGQTKVNEIHTRTALPNNLPNARHCGALCGLDASWRHRMI